MKPAFDANDWACAGFAIAHGGAHRAPAFEETWGFLLASLVERPTLGLPTAAFDFGSLLAGQPLLPFRLDVPGLLRDAVREWEDHVLARLLGDRRFVLLQEAYTAQPHGLKGTVAGLLVATWAERLSLAAPVTLSVGKLRALGKRGMADVMAQGLAKVSQEGPLVTELAASLRRACAQARKQREWVTDAEVFLAENVASLKGLASRVALAQAASATQALLESAPGRLKARRDHDADIPVQSGDDDAYPMGGFTSLTTRGSLENLATTELAYMEQGDERPDFFDVRFVDDSLLYYARDESMAFRQKRVVAFVFEASLKRARVVDEGEKYQRLLWVQALCAALVRRLGQWLDGEGLVFQLWFVKEGGEAPLSEEAGVLWLLLREFRQSGRVTFHEAASIEEVWSALQAVQAQRVEVVVASAAAGLPKSKSPSALTLALSVDRPTPTLQWRTAGKKSAVQLEENLSWRAAFHQMLRVLP
ncbi:MAG: hypothetical protein K1X64_11095 [Myxococcaceae bacterium]|nr:hypothetical protein [Myxococcaceae bacterium]